MKRIALIALPISLMILASLSACRRTAGPEGAEAAEAKAGPAGTITLTPEAVAGGGIVVEAARTIEAVRTVHAPGEFEFDPRRVADVSARAAGRIERLAAYAGDRVAAGQVLAEIYSPDYLALQSELLLAGERAGRLKEGPDSAPAAALLEAARKKLLPLGLSGGEIDAILASGSIRPVLELRSPLTGVVVSSQAVLGGQVEAATILFRIADPSMLRARVDIYEKDLSSVRVGDETALSTQAYPGTVFKGRLVFIGATMDSKTRTIEGRIEFANPDGRVKPGMFVEARLRTPAGRRVLVVPEGAVQEVQSRPVVFVRTGPSTFVLRPVETGEHIDGTVEIVKGLTEGEEVVAAGAFLLKSELLKSSLGD